jgi:hypothetical protein
MENHRINWMLCKALVPDLFTESEKPADSVFAVTDMVGEYKSCRKWSCNEISCSIKSGKFLELLTDCSYLKRTVLQGVEFLHHMIQFYHQTGNNTIQKCSSLHSRTTLTPICLKLNAKSTWKNSSITTHKLWVHVI